MANDRRSFLKSTAAGLATLGGYSLMPRSSLAEALTLTPEALPEGAQLSAKPSSLPGKLPLIKRTWRPPNYETPLIHFDQTFTSNEAFFVRYHLSAIPEVSASQWRLQISGEVSRSLQFSLEDLKREFEQVELVAVCMCAGNRRGLMHPPVPGVQWGPGAMGNARWKGVRLHDVLKRAGIGSKAVEVSFAGSDAGALEKTPAFVKSLPTWKALDEHTLIAFEMNGSTLPHWNGFPARLVVPGWAATYWMKHLTHIDVLTEPLDNFWMQTTYRIPKGLFPEHVRFASQESEDSVAVTEIMVNSLILHPEEGMTVQRSQDVELTGLAWDGGYGIERVDVSLDQGRSWLKAELGMDHGRHAWRSWRFGFKPSLVGDNIFLVRATNQQGTAQPMEIIHNPSGYHHNAVQELSLRVI